MARQMGCLQGSLLYGANADVTYKSHQGRIAAMTGSGKLPHTAGGFPQKISTGDPRTA
jgi:hypothetical protein